MLFKAEALDAAGVVTAELGRSRGLCRRHVQRAGAPLLAAPAGRSVDWASPAPSARAAWPPLPPPPLSFSLWELEVFCHFSSLWRTLHLVLMYFFRGDFRNCSLKVILKWEQFFDSFSALLAFFMHYICQLKVLFGSPLLLKFMNASCLSRQMLLFVCVLFLNLCMHSFALEKELVCLKGKAGS